MYPETVSQGHFLPVLIAIRETVVEQEHAHAHVGQAMYVRTGTESTCSTPRPLVRLQNTVRTRTVCE